MNLRSTLELAEECLVDVEENHVIHRPRVCIGRSYYYLFHCIQALLASQNVFVKTHSGAINKFNELFILSGKFDRSYALLAAKLFEERMDADYDAECQFDDQEQKEAIASAKSFLEATQHYLKEQNLL